ncbi:MAG: hypothetical protein WCY29_17960 [Novosphingobium sp.]
MTGTSTIQGAIDRGESIRAYCNACHHHALLDLIALRDKYGPDFSMSRKNLAPRLRCTACKGTNISLICTPGTPEYGGNPYTKAKGG